MRTSKTVIKPAIGIIGGSGLYHIEGMEKVREVRVRTPYGPPSDALVGGTLSGVRVVFLSRHGRGHRTNPTSINYRANIAAIRQLGVKRVLATNAVGSLRLDLPPGSLAGPWARSNAVMIQLRHVALQSRLHAPAPLFAVQ